MPEPSDQPAKPVDHRDRGVYIWWGVGLGVLGILGLACWLLLAPFLRVKAAVDRLAREDVKPKINPHYDAPAAVNDLGGIEPALRQVTFYMHLPGRIAPNRWLAVRILDACGAKAFPHLVGALRADDSNVRTEAACALSKYGVRAVPALVRALGDPEPSVVVYSALSLGRIGPDAKAAVPMLEKATTDPRKDMTGSWPLFDERGTVRWAAAEALKEIRGEEPPK